PKRRDLAGIGRPAVLANLGIDVVHAMRDVGENLQDHLQIRTVFKVTGVKTLNAVFNSRFGKAGMALRYALTQSGPMSMAPSQFGMFTRSDPSRATPRSEEHTSEL